MMAALDPRIEVIREKYGLERDSFWELPQKKGTWVAKHSALEVVAAKARIEFDPPQVIEANTVEGIAVLAVRGYYTAPPDMQGEVVSRSAWSTGEASPKNNKNGYPWAMAEKRAVDRVILKLVGIHGLVYSEEEAAFDTPQQDHPEPKTLVKDQRVLWAEMRDEIDACQSLDDLAVLWRSVPFQAELKKLKESWQESLTQHKDSAKAALSNGRPYAAPNFANPDEEPAL